MRPLFRTALTTALAALTPFAAIAHDIAIFPEWNGDALGVDVRYGHPEDYQPIAAEKLYRFDVRAPGAPARSWRKDLKLDAMDLRMTRKPDWDTGTGITLLTAQYDNGYWSKDDAGDTVNTSRITHPKTSMASHNVKFGKALVATGPTHAGFDQVVGHKLELIPLADPLAVKTGALLPVAVRYNGRPLAGAGVEIGDSVTGVPEDRIPRYTTDAKGIAQVPIGPSGWAVLGVDHEERSPTPKLADKEKYTATFVFRVQ